MSSNIDDMIKELVNNGYQLSDIIDKMNSYKSIEYEVLIKKKSKIYNFEQKITNLKASNPEDYNNLDWSCISQIQHISETFVIDNFEKIKFIELFSSKFYNERFYNYVINNVKNQDLFKIINLILKNKILSEEFKKNILKTQKNNIKDFVKIKELRPVKFNSSFENIINEIKCNFFEEFKVIDFVIVSKYKFLSGEFIQENIEHLNINNLITFQIFDKETISMVYFTQNIDINILAKCKCDEFPFSLQWLLYQQKITIKTLGPAIKNQLKCKKVTSENGEITYLPGRMSIYDNCNYNYVFLQQMKRKHITPSCDDTFIEMFNKRVMI